MMDTAHAFGRSDYAVGPFVTHQRRHDRASWISHFLVRGQTVICNRAAAVRQRQYRFKTSSGTGTACAASAFRATRLREPVKSLPAERDDDALCRFLEHSQVGKIHKALQRLVTLAQRPRLPTQSSKIV